MKFENIYSQLPVNYKVLKICGTLRNRDNKAAATEISFRLWYMKEAPQLPSPNQNSEKNSARICPRIIARKFKLWSPSLANNYIEKVFHQITEYSKTKIIINSTKKSFKITSISLIKRNRGTQVNFGDITELQVSHSRESIISTKEFLDL